MANKILHKRSSVITNGKPKLPTSSQIEYGELAVNYAKDNETISLKNNENKIVEFATKNYHDTNLTTHNNSLADSGTTGHVKIITGDVKNKTYVKGEAAAAAHTHGDYLTAHQSISHLATKNELSGYTTDAEYSALQTIVSGKADSSTVSTLSTKVNNHISSANTHVDSTEKSRWNAVTAKTNASTFNSYTSTTKTTLEGLRTDVDKKALKSDLTTLSGTVGTLRSDFNTLVSGNTKTTIESFKEVTAFLSGVTDTQSLDGILASLATKESVDNLVSEIETNEEITAASLTNLDERVSAVDEKIDGNNEAISASLNDLNERIIVLDADLSNKPSYDDLDNYATYGDLDNYATKNEFTGHTGNTYVHVTSSDKTNWNKVSNKLDTSTFNTYTGATNTTISNLQTTVNGKAPISHSHSANDITGGTLALARIPTGTTSSTVARGDHSHSNYVTTDTKNTTGSDNTSSKIFLIGSTAQTTNNGYIRTYSHDTAYVGTDGYLYSNNEKVDMRLTTSLVPIGTAIPSGANLNTITYLKVGKYYCGANTTVETLENCPTKIGFMMEVYSPLSTTIDNESTTTWCYRLRKITTYTGNEYIQYCVSNASKVWTYNSWKLIPKSNVSGTTLSIGSETQPVYINSSGELKACTSYSSTTVNNANNVRVVYNDTGTTKMYLTFVDGAASSKTLYDSAKLSYTPSTGSLTASTMYSTAFYETSDERLKNFQDKIPVDLDKLSKLKKNYFTWKDKERGEKLEIGVSAQEIKKLYPEIVSDEGDTLSVAYDKLSVVALSAVDVLYEENKSLKNKVSELEEQIKNINEFIKTLKKINII